MNDPREPLPRQPEKPLGAAGPDFSNFAQRVRISILAGVATIIAVYMGLYQWRLIDTVWDPVFGAQTLAVLDSDVSHRMYRLARIPDAVLGALAYLGDIIFAIAGCTRRWLYRPWLVIVFGVDVILLSLISAILIMLQGVVVGSWCLLCMVTAVISLIMLAMAWREVFACLRFLRRVWQTSNRKLFWDTLWGRPSKEAYEAGLEIERAALRN
jgi:uncharacterized membrane protein